MWFPSIYCGPRIAINGLCILVRIVVCDMGPNNKFVFTKLNLSKENPWFIIFKYDSNLYVKTFFSLWLN